MPGSMAACLQRALDHLGAALAPISSTLIPAAAPLVQVSLPCASSAQQLNRARQQARSKRRTPRQQRWRPSSVRLLRRSYKCAYVVRLNKSSMPGSLSACLQRALGHPVAVLAPNEALRNASLDLYACCAEQAV